ncbi:MAG: hypothetical protein LBJ17_04310 [Dysgonamonadaceae bacterium]|nr:hypothetical protein [Dysgonamonadaceae bacterium]
MKARSYTKKLYYIIIYVNIRKYSVLTYKSSIPKDESFADAVRWLIPQPEVDELMENCDRFCKLQDREYSLFSICRKF